MKALLKQFIKLFIVSSIASATPVDDLQQTLTQFNTLTAHFSQTIVNDQGQLIEKSTGEIAIVRPDKFYWNKRQPTAQQVIINQGKAWIIDPDLKQATRRSLNTNNDLPAMLLTSRMNHLDNLFTVTALPKPKTAPCFALVSKTPDTTIAKIILCFQKNKISSMQFSDQLGIVTRIEFSQITLNTPIKSTLFDFNPPATMDVFEH